METAVVSGMLAIVGNRLAPLVIKEYSSVVGVKKDLQELQSLVEEINYCLENAGDKTMGSGPPLRWLKLLKDVIYDVDDIVDDFHLEAEKNDTDGDMSKHSMSKYLCRKPKSLLLQCKTAHKIRAIKNRLAAIVRQRTNVSAIANNLPVGHPIRHIVKATGETPSLPIVDAISVIGRDQEKQQIISKLVETQGQQELKIVSIIGLGGSGKTTLASLVFNDFNIVDKHFGAKLWVHVSQEFVIENLIKKLFESIADKDPGQHALPYMTKRIKEELTGKRFLLVLDDVWTESRIQWENLMVHLKSGAPGSRILITARSRKVAETVGSSDQFVLPFLSPDDSWQLFQQSLVIPVKGLELEFVEVGKEIVRKCGGVPLAIKALAGVLYGKERIEEWKSLRDSNLLDVEDEEHSVSVSACLKLSYFHLPSHLKECFKLCSVFPKGHEIDKEKLIDQWIAHDIIITVDDVDYLEYTGQRCFDYLVKISFLQNVDEYNGRVICRMHDLVHDLSRSILGDELSLVVPMESTSSATSYRYFSLVEDSVNLPSKNVFRKARALYIAMDDDFRLRKTLKNAKHLRSITVKPLHATSTSVITGVLRIKHLRYLCISFMSFDTIPEAISELRSLQALHVTNSLFHQKLPESIGKLQKLRTLNFSGCKGLLSIPDSIGNCRMISSIDLWGCVNLTALPNSIGNNFKLRVLGLGHTRIERLPSRIITLGNLEYLDLRCCKSLVDLPEGIENLQKLQLLNLEECDNLRAMPIGIGRLNRLHNLSIFIVGKGDTTARISELGNIARNSVNLTIRDIVHVVDPNDAYKACLEQKTNLQRLQLKWGSDVDGINIELQQAVLDGLELPVGIKELYIRRYAGGRYARWMLTQVNGTLQEVRQYLFLTFMKLSDLPNLKDLKGLVELPCLEDLRLLEMPSLESISGGPFPWLVKLKLFGLSSLKEVWMVTLSTLAMGDEGGSCSGPHQLGQVLIGTRLSHLEIERCPKLMVKPYLPLSLEKLTLFRSNEQLLRSLCLGQGSSSSSSYPPSSGFCHLKELELWYMTAALPPQGSGSERSWELLQHMTVLESLHICKCDTIAELPESMRSLTSLQSLCIDGSSAIHVLPEWLGELQSLQKMIIMSCDSMSRLPQSMGDLTCLQVLRIEWCDALDQLPECLGQLCSLRKFVIQHLRGLTCLPQSMCRLNSLEQLVIHDCPGIKSLPEGIKDLTSLQQVDISCCPDLVRRCKREKGEDWHLISHISHLVIC